VPRDIGDKLSFFSPRKWTTDFFPDNTVHYLTIALHDFSLLEKVAPNMERWVETSDTAEKFLRTEHAFVHLSLPHRPSPRQSTSQKCVGGVPFPFLKEEILCLPD